MPTQDLGPERVKEFETGFDLGLWEDKADLGFTWYRALSTDVILNLPVAGSSGYTQKPANAASLRNAGVEVAPSLARGISVTNDRRHRNASHIRAPSG